MDWGDFRVDKSPVPRMISARMMNNDVRHNAVQRQIAGGSSGAVQTFEREGYRVELGPALLQSCMMKLGLYQTGGMSDTSGRINLMDR